MPVDEPLGARNYVADDRIVIGFCEVRLSKRAAQAAEVLNDDFRRRGMFNNFKNSQHAFSAQFSRCWGPRADQQLMKKRRGLETRSNLGRGAGWPCDVNYLPSTIDSSSPA
jgi:hypothetical protein